MNLLYRAGQVPVYRSYANLTPEVVKYVKSIGQDITVEVPNFERNQIPWRYNFFNPVSLEVKDSNINLFLGTKIFKYHHLAF